MTDPTVYPIILGRFDSWTYFVQGAVASDDDVWETASDITRHLTGYQDPSYVLGVLNLSRALSQPRIQEMLRLLYPEGRIQVEPLTSIKEISRSIRLVKELNHVADYKLVDE